MFKTKLKNILFKETFSSMSTAKSLALVGVFTALSVVANVFSIDVSPSLKISFLYFFGFFCGAIFGPLVAFAICFLGDLLAFLIPVFSSGIYWLPTGICSGLLGFIPGLVFTTLKFKFRGGVFVKTAISVLATYVLVTLLAGALSNYYYVKFVVFAGREYQKTFIAYLGAKILFSSIVSALNYALIFATIPVFNSIKSIGFKIE